MKMISQNTAYCALSSKKKNAHKDTVPREFREKHHHHQSPEEQKQST